MIKEVSIQGFRLFEDFTLKGPTKFNIFVGPNNSGKSSLLEALFLHCAPVNFRVLLSLGSFRYGGYHSNPQYIFDQIKWFFTRPIGKNTVKLTISGKWEDAGKATERVTSAILHNELSGESDFRTQFKNSSDSIVSSSEDIHVKEPTHEAKGIVIGTVALAFESSLQDLITKNLEFVTGEPLRIGPPAMKTDIKAVYSSPCTYKGPDAGLESYNESAKSESGHDKKCIELIRKIDPDVEDADILLGPDNSPQLYIRHKRLGLTPIGNFGDGIRRMFHLATLFAQCQDGVMLIDELESAIHTTALEQFIDWIVEVAQELNVQVFATTYSLECIDTILGSSALNKDNLGLFRLRQQADLIACKEIEGETLEKLRYELGQDVR